VNLTRTLGRATAVALLLAAPLASGAGMYFSDRGVRPMGRAGAFVAGADDLHGAWYNPAGIADAGDAGLVDFAWLAFQNTYQRRLRIVDADDTVRYVDSPKISGSSDFLPMPTFAASMTLDKEKRWTGAIGFVPPMVAFASYPERTNDGQPSPARYTLGGFAGSAPGIPGAWLAWKPHDKLRIGVGAYALVGWFQSQITFSVCPPDRLVCAPEQPEWDAQSQMRIGPMFAPTANGGLIYTPDPHVRLGFSGQLPQVISAPATIKVRLPTSAAVDGASVRGDKAHVRLVLPAIVRFGIELRPFADDDDESTNKKKPKKELPNDLRIELAWVHEFWSQHKSIEAKPDGIFIENITAAPSSIAMPNITIPRTFKDSDSFRLGAEWWFNAGSYRMATRAGVSYETSAVPPGYVSLSSLDFNKTVISLGGAIVVSKKWRFDAVIAQTFAEDVVVTPEQTRIERINPLSGNAPREAVNGGTYTARATLMGVGLNYTF